MFWTSTKIGSNQIRIGCSINKYWNRKFAVSSFAKARDVFCVLCAQFGHGSLVPSETPDFGQGTAAPNDAAHELRVRDTTAATGATTDQSTVASSVLGGLKSSGQNAASAVNGAVSDTTENLSTLITNIGSTAMDFGNQTIKTVEEMAKASSRITLALFNLFNRVFNGVSATVATSTGYVSSGVGNVNGYLGSVPVVNMFSSGLNKVTSGLSKTINQMSSNGRLSRNEFFDGLRNSLDGNTDTTSSTSSSTSSTTSNTAASDITATASK